MTTKTIWAELGEVNQHLQAADFRFWFDRKLITDARREIERKIKKRIQPADFKAARAACKWWKKIRRASPSPDTLLDTGEWQELRAAVLELAEEIKGRPIEEAVAIVSTIKRCNKKTLSGLNSDLHFWKLK